MNTFRFITAGAVAALLAWPALAGPGHDHDHAEATPAATGPAQPRFAAASELFELVGVLNGRQLTLYLDRTADNAPVTGAAIELEIGGVKHRPAAHDDVYELVLPAAPRPGVLPVTATVTAGADIDLLAGELDIPDEAPAEAVAHAHGWRALVPWAAGGLGAIGVLIVVGRRLTTTRQASQTRHGAAA